MDFCWLIQGARLLFWKKLKKLDIMAAQSGWTLGQAVTSCAPWLIDQKTFTSFCFLKEKKIYDNYLICFKVKITYACESWNSNRPLKPCTFMFLNKLWRIKTIIPLTSSKCYILQVLFSYIYYIELLYFVLVMTLILKSLFGFKKYICMHLWCLPPFYLAFTFELCCCLL